MSDAYRRREVHSSYRPSEKHFSARRHTDNFRQLYRELKALHHEADADDLVETVQEINIQQAHLARRDADRRQRISHSVYVTLDKAIEAYKSQEITEKQFDHFLKEARERLSSALHKRSEKELKKKRPSELRLTEIINRETMQQVAAFLAFIFSLLSFDQVRVTGMTVSGASGGYDYYSLFGFLFLALFILLLLLRKK